MSENNKRYVYFVSFSYLTLGNQLRNGRINLTMDWEVDNMVKVNEMENQIREFMFKPTELFGLKYPPACEGDPFSVSIINFQLLRTEDI